MVCGRTLWRTFNFRQESLHPAYEELVAEDEEVLLLERLEPAIVEAQTISNV